MPAAGRVASTWRVHLEFTRALPLFIAEQGFFFSFGEKYRQAAIYSVSKNTGNIDQNTGKSRTKFAN
jgi:hypothetical protein